MKKIFLLIALFNFSLITYCQQAKDTIDYSKELKQVQVPPMFPGGSAVLKVYLERSDLEVGADSNDNKTAIVSFLVAKDGSLSEITVTNEDKIDSKLAKKAKDIITKGPKWMPAIQNGRNAIYRKTVLITR